MNKSSRLKNVMSILSMWILLYGSLVEAQEQNVQEKSGVEKHFDDVFKKANEQYSHIKKGDRFLDKGQTDAAIKEFEIALAMSDRMTRGEAYYHLANAKEKQKRYKEALEHVREELKTYVSEEAKGPEIERAKYLEYAAQGEYALAVEHAQKAVEVQAHLPGVPKEVIRSYMIRLNDLIAAKDYILSLKENGAGK